MFDRLAGEQARLLLQTRRAQRHDAGPAAPVRRWARLLAGRDRRAEPPCTLSRPRHDEEEP